jgi:hypothetical protein
MDGGRMRAVVAAGVAVLALATGCATEPGTAQWERDLADAEARWHAAALRNYTLSLVRTCDCVSGQTRPVTVTVLNGAFTGLVYADSLGGAADTTLFQQYLTVDRYFTLLHQVLASGPYDFSAIYNQSIGFPISVTVNPERMTTGDEFLVAIYAFTAGSP